MSIASLITTGSLGTSFGEEPLSEGFNLHMAILPKLSIQSLLNDQWSIDIGVKLISRDIKHDAYPTISQSSVNISAGVLFGF